jgi:hypothetical protein
MTVVRLSGQRPPLNSREAEADRLGRHRPSLGFLDEQVLDLGVGGFGPENIDRAGREDRHAERQLADLGLDYGGGFAASACNLTFLVPRADSYSPHS